ncbi:hypothetical protein [Sutcliffiella horikoshii]|uniref:hypothetical protein n=1 Tax=Sutcliffiella horikoshii TaxID=79883 RepID=UPI001F3CD580|nr:hypothetical protein [Sutcliffiella horikoshii]
MDDINTLRSPNSKWYHKAGAAASLASNFVPGAGVAKLGVKAVAKYGVKNIQKGAKGLKAKKFVATTVKQNRTVKAKKQAVKAKTKPKPVQSVSKGNNRKSNNSKGSVSKRWKVGDDVYKPTSKGKEPAWNTVRSRYWKNEAASANAIKKYGAENVARMKKGNAPQRYNPDKGGMESKELSHEPIPKRDGGKDFVPRWPQDHAKVDPFRRPGY